MREEHMQGVRWLILFLSSSLLQTYFIHAQSTQQGTFDPPAEPLIVVANRTTSTIRIDGVLDEQVWLSAQPYDGFIQYEPEQGSLPTRYTEVRVLYDEKYLYIAAFNAMLHGKRDIRVQNLQRDFDYDQNDLFGVAIDGFLDKRNAMVFQCNPYGAQRELLALDGTNFNREWDGLWRVRTHLTDSGWFAEIALPWKTLRYPNDCRELGIVFTRNIRKNNENLTLPAQPRAYAPYRMAYAARLQNIQPPPPSFNLLFNPYALVDVQERKVGDQSSSESSIKAGGELKWAANPTTVLDLTYNTDFAQVDVDRQVVNLTRFSVFFPERRQFFLEAAEIYTNRAWSTLQPFFSRRIGLDEEGNPIPIEAGTRLTHRSSKHTIGALAIRQRADEKNTPANFVVARYARNFSTQSRAGGMLTYRHDEADSTGQGIHNTTVTADGFFRPSQKVNVYWILSGSQSNGRISDRGFSGAVWASLNTNDIYFGHIQAIISEGYNPRSGFVDDTNYMVTSPAVTWKWRPDWRPSFARQFNPGVTVFLYNRQSDLAFREGFVSLRPVSIDFQNGGELFYSVIPNWQNLFETFYPLGIAIAPGRYEYLRHRMGYRTDFSKKLAGDVSYTTGAYFDGQLNTLLARGRLAPDPRVALTMSYEYNQITSLGIDNIDRDTQLAGVEMRMALNPRVQLISFYQYNTAASRSTLNARFVWEYRPLSFLFLVINDNRFDQTNPETLLTEKARLQQGIFKLTYLKQF
ncbi:MAG: carbohydrate binding family 9 domain-containing protein [Cyclobacteriaceae bacterium]|nr:carbohydrate binding family 9 domain-containing protein [Cyclobacteriaceae bacterium]